jgi:phosphate transport system ATP-binding protein
MLNSQVSPSISTSDPVLETRQLSISYDGKAALSDVSLNIPRGEITAIIGPSGCGKTSFLQAINRIGDMIPGFHINGDVLLDGQSVYSQFTDLIALRRRVGMIFQKPNPFPLSIRRNIDLPLQEHGYHKRTERDEIIRRVLQDVGLWDEVQHRLDSSALTLSGGQQQRLCIARALALGPEVLLFDEPCSALDPIASRTVEQLIQSLRAQATIVVVTHNLPQARRVADQVAMFWFSDGSGRLIESGPAADVFQSPRQAITAAYVQGLEG